MDVAGHEITEAGIDRLTHRSRCGAVPFGMTGRKKLLEIGSLPVADAGRTVVGDVVGAPTGRQRAAKFFAVVEREGEIARRMTLAAMRERFREISPAVPFRALRRVGLETPVSAEEHVPNAHQPALIEGKAQRVLDVFLMHRREAEEIGLD